ncbi:MAG: fatty acid desaturase [Verrucomicrobiales bacterium]|nr:fatty acid desaturase [Verrucomicrobiales bacterium]
MSTPTTEETRFQEELDRLRIADNLTNFLFLGRAWLILAITIGAFVLFDIWRSNAGYSLLLNLPFWILAILVIGASQHQLAGAGHEGTHYTLFRNRTLNNLASNWLCMFPILTSTEVYRKQHFAHHQHVNDPVHDPDLAQLQSSGHEFQFPKDRKQVIRLFLRQLLPQNLIRYTFHRARFSAMGIDASKHVPPASRTLFFPYFFLLLATHGILAHFELSVSTVLLATLVLIGIMGIATFILQRRPKHRPGKASGTDSKSEPSIQRYVHATLLLLTITLIHLATGLETLVYFAVLWLVPLITSFSFFMMMRQTIQHANCDQGRFSNTRVFLVNPLLRYAVFPFGMDYHLPHHLYSNVPHYRLKSLHELLKVQPEYDRRGAVVKGCVAREPGPQYPGLVDALGPEYEPGHGTANPDYNAPSPPPNTG